MVLLLERADNQRSAKASHRRLLRHRLLRGGSKSIKSAVLAKGSTAASDSSPAISPIALLASFLMKGAFEVPFCIGDVTNCAQKDILRSIPGTAAFALKTNGGGADAEVKVSVPELKLGALAYSALGSNEGALDSLGDLGL